MCHGGDVTSDRLRRLCAIAGGKDGGQGSVGSVSSRGQDDQHGAHHSGHFDITQPEDDFGFFWNAALANEPPVYGKTGLVAQSIVRPN